MGMGALEALRQNNLAGTVPVVGIDGIDAALAAVEAGEFAGTVAWDPIWTGAMGLAIPHAHVTGKIDITKEPKEHREFYGTGVVVTKDTVAAYKANPPKTDFNDLWGKATSMSYLEQWRRWAPLVVLLALCILIGLFSPNFLSLGNFIRLLNSAAIPIVLCMGATFIILMGSIDLSVEGVVALTAVIASLLVTNDITSYSLGLLAVPVAMAIGGGMGFLNGFVHVKLKTPSFMTTLGIGFAGLGIATAILGGLTVRISDQEFRFLSLGRVLDVPMAVWIAAASVAVAYVIQERTRIGRWLYAIGTD